MADNREAFMFVCGHLPCAVYKIMHFMSRDRGQLKMALCLKSELATWSYDIYPKTALSRCNKVLVLPERFQSYVLGYLFRVNKGLVYLRVLILMSHHLMVFTPNSHV